MATLSGTYDIRFGNVGLKKRTASAVAKAAYDVINESSATSNHTDRLVWAGLALTNAHDMAEKMLWGVLQNPTVVANPDTCTDNDIQFVVNSLIDAYAG